ncbi:interleukin-1 receptor-associated kinase-like 2 [Sorex fumeus]|uniref:interleukin-1 receptor-associated kinase-like 2 n=1 Tax=Sorex fumeus TaxID=62283 RepID=UPI0024AD51C0|nr:interleukin-1 receptor-associated kinase-like 2 [Sorex fumeus]
MSCYIYQLPAWVLDDLCRNMDTLSEWDWMQFASYVITDLTQLRRIKSLERVQGVSVTRELLWWWGTRQATVQDLLDLLHRLELYRAAQIVLDWNPGSKTPPSLPDPPDSAPPGRPQAASVQDTEDGQRQGQPRSLVASQDPGPVAPAASIPDAAECPLSLKPPSLDSKDSQPCSTPTPQQEVLWGQSADGLFWEEEDVRQATDSFSPRHLLHRGTFADIYRGQRHGTALVLKRLKEVPGAGPSSVTRLLEAEVQVCRRCCHPNVLPLLGFCPGKPFSLVYPWMTNGSLHDRLQCEAGSSPLPWPQRVGICSGLLRAVAHLHSLGIVHGNIRSSNVLLDGALTPRLAHPATQLFPVHERSGYTLMKTGHFQASAAYLPESALRLGRPSERADVFSCGIVLAEVLTGMPAMDEARDPVYLKDLLLRETPDSSSASRCSRRKSDAEKALAQELCLRHLDSRAGRLPEDCALALALAACLCLHRKNPSLAEARGLVDTVEERLRGQEVSTPCGGLSRDSSSAPNTPEETDDVEVSPLNAACAWPGAMQTCGPAGAGSSSSSGALASPSCTQEATSWKIEINDAKRKLMEDIVLYKEDKLDSSELFGF